MKLGTINKLIQWTGFVLVVAVDDDKGHNRKPTTLSLVFVGWPPDEAWARHCERSRSLKGPP